MKAKMEEETLKIKARIGIQKTGSEIFEAIVDPAKMSNYFISQGSGRMEEGATLTWKFPEFDMEFPVRVGKIEKDKYVSFYWGDEKEGETFVEIKMKPFENDTTIVIVTEGEKKADEAGIKWLAGNTEGWVSFLHCLKAYVECGINLRKGAWEFLTKDEEFRKEKGI
jgi:uncharacterized protein YndB with AHSA1/START domain